MTFLVSVNQVPGVGGLVNGQRQIRQWSSPSKIDDFGYKLQLELNNSPLTGPVSTLKKAL